VAEVFLLQRFDGALQTIELFLPFFFGRSVGAVSRGRHEIRT
jgi:hypothetical protein